MMSTTTTLDYAVAHLTDDSEVAIPYWHVDSGQDGETFLVNCAQHGNEVQGCESIRLFKQLCETDLKRGSVYLVPFTNLPAVKYRRPHINLGPEQPYADAEGHNMNRTWPGNPEGNDTERVSYAIHEAVVRHCTRCLDLHSWSGFFASATLAPNDGGLVSEMAETTAIRFISWSKPDEPGVEHTPSTITRLFNNTGRGAVCIEQAGQYEISTKKVELGLRAATNLAKLFGMMDGEPELLDGPVIGMTDDMGDRKFDLNAPCSGLFVGSGLQTAASVEEGQKLGHIIRDDNLETMEIFAPVSGYLLRYGCYRPHSDVALPARHPYASEGDPLATVVVP